ncbi:MAG: amino acid ABC transporter substrate-binding protein [Beijerinckiaceae bacterium]
MLKTWLAAALAAAGLMAASPAAAQSNTMEQVRQRGALNCGVSQGLIGFSERKADGTWSGFDVDVCRAIAAVVLGDASKVSFVPLSAAERFDALRQGRIDVLSRNTTWTLQREAEFGLLFSAVVFHDGQGFMVHRDLNVTSALELDKRKLCVQAGTTAQATVGEYFAANSMAVAVQTYPDAAATLAAFSARQCDVMTTDNSGLFAERLKLPQPQNAVILPDIVSKEPLGPATRADDIRWHNVVKWIAFALINAEELGITSQNIADAQKSQKPEVRRFAGAEGGLGAMLGLPGDWALKAVASVGNYAELYERNVGTGSRLGIPRGLNQLWSNGGILFAPPIR